MTNDDIHVHCGGCQHFPNLTSLETYRRHLEDYEFFMRFSYRASATSLSKNDLLIWEGFVLATLIPLLTSVVFNATHLSMHELEDDESNIDQ